MGPLEVCSDHFFPLSQYLTYLITFDHTQRRQHYVDTMEGEAANGCMLKNTCSYGKVVQDAPIIKVTIAERLHTYL